MLQNESLSRQLTPLHPPPPKGKTQKTEISAAVARRTVYNFYIIRKTSAKDKRWHEHSRLQHHFKNSFKEIWL
jgi:hypothetical protein